MLSRMWSGHSNKFQSGKWLIEVKYFRWHDDRLWVSDWGAREIIAVDLDRKSEVMVKLEFPSFQAICFDREDRSRYAHSYADLKTLVTAYLEEELCNHSDVLS
jgi:hypothetical protein